MTNLLRDVAALGAIALFLSMVSLWSVIAV